MTKSEHRKVRADESFWYNDAESIVRLISQLVPAATSVGANYVETDDAVSKKQFLKSIGTCRKEARETKHFLRMIVRAVPELKPQARKLWLESKELSLIFSKFWRSK
ncbi:MAG TPA: four helix bundle protein [Candidatus Udaeobacter sp.]|nr:four helix bundle protein [Candidatus Udaeobacter sp.]